jgi:CRP-like cAMP-binding protein
MADQSPTSAILDLFGSAEARTVRAGQTLFREGEPGGAMFVVLEGELEITIRGITMERVGPGGIVGELAIVDESPRTASVGATVDSRVAEVPARRFEALVQQAPALATLVVRVLAQRLRKMNQYL